MLLCIQKHLQCTEAHLFFQMSGLNTEILKMSDYRFNLLPEFSFPHYAIKIVCFLMIVTLIPRGN